MCLDFFDFSINDDVDFWYLPNFWFLYLIFGLCFVFSHVLGFLTILWSPLFLVVFIIFTL
jgi:hypothetical protein